MVQLWLVVVATITIFANAGIAVADIGGARFVVENSTELRLPPALTPIVATLKLAGALGLLVGLIGLATDMVAARVLGLAAAIGLFLFYSCALAVHVRAGVFHNIVYPTVFWLLAVGCVALSLIS